jgi:hypothetical protein
MNLRDRLLGSVYRNPPDAPVTPTPESAAPAAPVSPAAPLPATGENAGAVDSSPTAPVAPVVEATPAPAEPVAEPARDFAPSILEVEGAKTPEPSGDAPKDAPKIEEPKPGDAKPAGAVTPEPPKVEAPAAIAYEFTFPEKVAPEAIDKAVLSKYTDALNKSPVRLPAPVAQELLDLHLSQVQDIGKRLADNQWDVFNRQQESWQTQVKADPELGGSRIKTVMRTAASFIEKFGGSPVQQKAIMDVMRTTGAGNHPEVLRLFYRAGEMMAREPQARNMPPARQVPLTREQKQAARYK